MLLSASRSDTFALIISKYSLDISSLPLNETKVDIPDFVSAEARDLIQKVLRRRPSERPTIDEIWKHPWVSMGGEGPLVAVVSAPDPELHAMVLAQLERAGHDVALVETMLAAGEVGGPTVDYHLLMEKAVRDREDKQRDAEIANAARGLAGLVGPDSPFRRKKISKMPMLGPSRRTSQTSATAEPSVAAARGSIDNSSARSDARSSVASVQDGADAGGVTPAATPRGSITGADEGKPMRRASTPGRPVLRPKREVPVPEGHRVSTDIDTGMQVVTPIRPSVPVARRPSGSTAHSAACPRRKSVSDLPLSDAVTPSRRVSTSRTGLVSLRQVSLQQPCLCINQFGKTVFD